MNILGDICLLSVAKQVVSAQDVAPTINRCGLHLHYIPVEYRVLWSLVVLPLSVETNITVPAFFGFVIFAIHRNKLKV